MVNTQELAGLGKGDDEAIRAHLDKVHSLLEALVHQFCNEAYGAIMESTQDYLVENVTHNLRERLRSAEAQAESDRQQLSALKRETDQRIRRLEAALRVSRGWMKACAGDGPFMSTEQATRDLKVIDGALGLSNPDRAVS